MLMPLSSPDRETAQGGRLRAKAKNVRPAPAATNSHRRGMRALQGLADPSEKGLAVQAVVGH